MNLDVEELALVLGKLELELLLLRAKVRVLEAERAALQAQVAPPAEA